MTHSTQADIGLVRLGESSFVPANLEDELRGKVVYNAEDYASPPYGDTGRATDRPDVGGYGPYCR